MNTKFKLLSMLFIIMVLTGCGEVETSNGETKPIEQREVTTQNEEFDQERYVAFRNSSSGLTDVIQKINSLHKTEDNSVKFSYIMDWVENVAIKVYELTDKDLRGVVAKSRSVKLFPATDNIFSTVRFLNLENNRKIAVANSTVLVKGDCHVASIKDSTLICTGDAYVESALNSIVIANGKIEVRYVGERRSDRETPYTAIVYTPNNIEVSHAINSVFLFSKNIKALETTTSDCINTKSFTSSTGSCNVIDSAF